MLSVRLGLLPLLLVACVDATEPSSEMLEPVFQLQCPGAECGSLTLDQVSDIASPNPFNLAIGGQSDQILAQVVTPQYSGRLTELGLAIGCGSDPASGGVDVEIRDVVASKPGNDVLLRVTVPHEEISPGITGFRRISLLPGVFVSAGTPFAFVLSSAGQCASNAGLEGDTYPGGDGWFIALPNAPGIWQPISLGTGRADLPFQTFVRVLPGKS